MPLEVGQIVKNITPGEAVVLTKIQPLGTMISISYTGVTSHQAGNKIVTPEEMAGFEVITSQGKFNFQGNPEKFKLYAEAERIRSAYQFDPLFAVNCSIVDPLPHQVEAVYKYLLPQPKIRFLLADDTGAGKTIMTGLLIKEMLTRGLIERILIITPGGLTRQWQEDEMGIKFNLTFKLVNRATFDSDPTIFHSSSKVITSIDFLRSEDVLRVVSETSWDIIIVDEAHKLSAFDYGDRKYLSKRYQVIETLATRAEHLLLLTATPHRGRRDTFRNLLRLLDDIIFASDTLIDDRIKEIGEQGVNKFFIRRLKEEMRDWNGQPLFKTRFTRTAQYELTPEEKRLYDRVTEYLTRRREEANRESNIHVSLALMVMQRRLTSSIYAITKTLRNRHHALQGLLEELAHNPQLWSQKLKFDTGLNDLDNFDDFDDEERQSLENILSDPRKFRLFTTSKSKAEIEAEAREVKSLLDLAEALYVDKQKEKKYERLSDLLRTEGVLDSREKLVIFTEHKDTMDYLSDRLRNSGYRVQTIHGGKSVEERRAAQAEFARDAQILVATDAAGEGINLQFCRLLINWDIPWNPNRLEQRMGRIHRYGQKQDVVVFNLVAQNTREGYVLQTLLNKLNLIRDQIGDDRVYDVISDIFENISLEDIINSTLNGQFTAYNSAIEDELTRDKVEKQIQQQKNRIGHSLVDYQEARRLKEHSDEQRLQPVYIRLFFEKAFSALGGAFVTIRPEIFRITRMPEELVTLLKDDYNILADVRQVLLCFDKQVFLEYQTTPDLGPVHYISPGNPVFDSLIKLTLQQYKEDMLRGTVLVSADDLNPYLAFFVRSRITDNRHTVDGPSIASEKVALVCQREENFALTSVAHLLDLHPPLHLAKTPPAPPEMDGHHAVIWSFEHITQPQHAEARRLVQEDARRRQAFLEEAFNTIILDLSAEINELQSRILLGDNRVQDKILLRQKQIEEIKRKKEERLQKLALMQQLSMHEPEVLGCAWIVPLTQVEYQGHFGMSRDDEAAAIAMATAMEFEKARGWRPEDVSREELGYDIRSVSPDGLKQYIEVKGRNAAGAVMLTENEMNRLAQLGDSAWLYIVINCRTQPELFRFQNPARHLSFKTLSKGVQYLLPEEEWKAKLKEDGGI